MDEHENVYLYALRLFGLIPLILGAVTGIIALIVYATAVGRYDGIDPDLHTMAVSTGWAEIGGVLFVVGFLTTAFWLVTGAITSKLTLVLGGELDDDIPAEDQDHPEPERFKLLRDDDK